MFISMTPRFFFSLLLSACLLYFGFETFAAYYSAMNVDDFNFSHMIYRYKSALPYRDFSPYKTVLGYYLLLPAMLSAQGLLIPLYHTKLFIAFLNGVLFFISGCWMTRFFPRAMVLASVVLVMFTECVLTHSTNIRVDVFAYWFCLFAFLLLLDNRYALAGMLLGVGFLFSQKALWLIVASNCAASVNWLCFTRNWRDIRHILLLNVCCALIVILYIAFWSSFSNLSLVIHNLFLDAAALFKLNIYEAARLYFWSIIVSQNPLPLLLWPIAVLSLFITTDEKNDPRQVMILTYSFVVMFSLITFKQPFPYFVLTAMPAFLLLYAAFFSWMSDLFNPAHTIRILFANKKTLILLTAYYLFLFVIVSMMLGVPKVYLSIGLIPIFLLCYIFSAEKNRVYPQLIFLTIVMNLIFPLISYFSTYENKSASYQKATLTLANQILQSGGDYVEGVDFFYDRTQPIPAMRHLDLVSVEYLTHQDPRLLPVMTPFLDHYPVTPTNILHALRDANIKFYINNYRMNGLPSYLQDWLAANYLHYWGSIYLYAPTVARGAHKINLKFSGSYVVKSASQITLDGKNVLRDERVQLSKGLHFSRSSVSYRLQLTTENSHDLENPNFKKDTWEKMLS